MQVSVRNSDLYEAGIIRDYFRKIEVALRVDETLGEITQEALINDSPVHESLYNRVVLVTKLWRATFRATNRMLINYIKSGGSDNDLHQISKEVRKFNSIDKVVSVLKKACNIDDDEQAISFIGEARSAALDEGDCMEERDAALKKYMNENRSLEVLTNLICDAEEDVWPFQVLLNKVCV